jgi:hypothetical protein
MSRLRTNARNPVHPSVASPAVEEDVAQFALEFGLRAEQFHPEALGCSD